MAVAQSIPVVDFKGLSTDSEVSSLTELVQQLHSAFSKVGFVFIKNHGIERDLVKPLLN